MLAVYKKEMRTYFNNMTGYLVIGLMLAIIGIFASFYNFKSGYPDFEYVLYSITFIFLILVPILTMHAFAEEKRLKTDQLLYSLPIKLSSVVIGKLLAMVSVYAIPLVACFLYPVILSIYGTVNFASCFGAIFAFFLLGCALIAIGIFVSTLTESQAISAFVSFLTLLVIYLMSDISSLFPSSPVASLIAFDLVIALVAVLLYYLTKNKIIALAVGIVGIVTSIIIYAINNTIFDSAFPSVMTKLSIFSRFTTFVNGVFDLTSIMYYISIICLFTFFSVQSLEKRRWM